LLAGLPALVLLAGLPGEARANFYAYAVQQTSGYTFTGATVGTLTPLTSTSAAQVSGIISGAVAHSGTLSPGQSYVGLAGTAPLPLTFTPKGLVDPDYARGDSLITAAPAAFGTNNVAEAFMIGPGNSAGSGSWAVSAPITLTAAGVLTLGFNFTNQLTLLHTGSPFPGTVAADFSYTFTVQNAAGAVVFTNSPAAINSNASLTIPGSINLPGSGSITISTTTLPAGTYTGTIAGSEHTFINSVPEPGSMGLLLIGLGALVGVGFRKRISLAQS
jgi:hypothetical protein